MLRVRCLSVHLQPEPRRSVAPLDTAGVGSAKDTATTKSKRIWFVRHGESETNVSEDWTHRDPDLTARGIMQAEAVPSDPILADALAPRTHL